MIAISCFGFYFSVFSAGIVFLSRKVTQLWAFSCGDES